MNDEFKIKISRRTAKLTSNVFCFCMIASLVFFGTILNAQQNPAGVNSGSLNVLDFGAKGDGIADDTDAIQKCFVKAAETYNPPEVFFPAGTYLVSRTLLIPPNASNKGWGFINIRGNAATIKQSDPAKDIFYLHRAFRNLIEGITFDGGKTQIRWWTENQNGGHIVVRDCFFKTRVSEVYNKIYKTKMDMSKQEEKFKQETDLLSAICNEEPGDVELIHDLLALQKTKTLMVRKRGLQADILRRISTTTSS